MQVLRLCLAVACLLAWDWPAIAADPQPVGQVEHVPPDEAFAILGSPVAAPDGKTIGRLVDVLVNAAGEPEAAVIDVGGFMGVGARKIAVHWSTLHFSPANPRLPITLDLTLDELKAAPEYRNPSKPAPVVLPVKAPVPTEGATPGGSTTGGTTGGVATDGGTTGSAATGSIPTGNPAASSGAIGGATTGNSPAAGNPTASSGATGSAMTGGGTAGGATAGSVSTGNPPTGNTSTGNPPTGNPPTGNTPIGNTPIGNPPIGNTPTGNPPASQATPPRPQ